MAEFGLTYGYDTSSKQNVRLKAFDQGDLGISLNSQLSFSRNNNASEANQDTMISTLDGISSNVELTVPGISGPTAIITNSIAPGGFLSNTINTEYYNNLTIFGKTDRMSSWKLVYIDSENNKYAESDSITTQESQSSISGGSFCFSHTWENVGSKIVDLTNASGGTDSTNIEFYYSLTR